MGIHRGPNTVKDGLTFGYDTGYGVADNDTATRFYPGQPTNNFMPTLYIAGSNVTSGTDETGDYKEGTITRIGCPNGTSINSGSTYTFTIELRSSQVFNMSADSNQYAPQNGGNDANRLSVSYIMPNYTTANEWVTYSTTVVMKSGLTNPTMFDFFIPVSFTGRLYYRNAQLEYNAQRTPYTTTSRSSTASLIDLKKTTDIDVSNVSFDSTGQPTFDNTDDRITMPNSSVFNHTSELSIEAWVKFVGDNNDFIFEKGNVNTQYSLFSHGSDIVFRTWHAGDSLYQSLFPSKTTAGITNGQWHHIVGSWDGSTKRIYVDGVDKASVSKSGALTTNSNGAAIGSFGGTSSGYYFGGDIAIVKIYDKGLSATEIKQNFNAYKNRFDI